MPRILTFALVLTVNVTCDQAFFFPSSKYREGAYDCRLR